MVNEMKVERDGRRMVTWSEYTKRTLLIDCTNTIQDKIKVRKAPIDEG